VPGKKAPSFSGLTNTVLRIAGSDQYARFIAIPDLINGIYDQLEELRQLYGLDQTTEEILAGIIDRRKRRNRLVALKSKIMVTTEKYEEIPFLERLFGGSRLQLGETKKRKLAQFPPRVEQQGAAGAPSYIASSEKEILHVEDSEHGSGDRRFGIRPGPRHQLSRLRNLGGDACEH
jgi:hypothetical protein